MNVNVPYERVVQWLAGPFAALVGVIASKAVTHLSWLGQAGLQGSSVAHGIVEGSVFVATAGVTFAAHSKWLGNLSKWWEASGLTQSNVPDSTVVPPPLPPIASASTDQGASDPVDILRDQLRAAGEVPVA